MTDTTTDTAARRALSRIMSAHASRILFHDRALAEQAWNALSDEPDGDAKREPGNWLEEECQKLHRFLLDCWEGTGSSLQEGSASLDYRAWSERALKMVRQARTYGQAAAIEAALAQDPAKSLRGGVGDYLNRMCEEDYVFDREDAIELRKLLAERETLRTQR